MNLNPQNCNVSQHPPTPQTPHLCYLPLRPVFAWHSSKCNVNPHRIFISFLKLYFCCRYRRRIIDKSGHLNMLTCAKSNRHTSCISQFWFFSKGCHISTICSSTFPYFHLWSKRVRTSRTTRSKTDYCNKLANVLYLTLIGAVRHYHHFHLW